MYTINYSWYRISNPVYFNNVQISFLVAWLFVGSGAVPAGISPIHLGLNGMLLCGELSELQFHSISLKYFHTLAELYNHSLKWLWFISLITYINLYQWRVEWWPGMPYISMMGGVMAGNVPVFCPVGSHWTDYAGDSSLISIEGHLVHY